MNRRIIFSALSIFASAAFVAGATFAFFSDSETSKDNQFTAGAIDLKIDNEAWFNGIKQGRLSWEVPADLTGQLFFDYSDLKPGDWEEDTISLHVDNNPSWVCANLKVTKDDDVSCTEPEMGDDGTCDEGEQGDGDFWDGDLGKELSFIFWADDGNNVLESGEHVVLSGTPADLPRDNNNAGETFPIVDSQNQLFGEGLSPLPGGQTVHIGKAFCFGTLTEKAALPSSDNSPDKDPGFVCDGSLVTNAAQTDKLMGDMSFMAVQSRKNEKFVCGEKTFLGLENKNDAWDVIPDGRYGNLSFTTAHPTFDYDLMVRGMKAETSYSLIYYPDPWSGTGSIEIGQFTTDSDGNANVGGDENLDTDLPIPADDNDAGAKLWVVLTDDYSGGSWPVWNPSEYLFERNLVAYDDTDAS